MKDLESGSSQETDYKNRFNVLSLYTLNNLLTNPNPLDWNYWEFEIRTKQESEETEIWNFSLYSIYIETLKIVFLMSSNQNMNSNTLSENLSTLCIKL